MNIKTCIVGLGLLVFVVAGCGGSGGNSSSAEQDAALAQAQAALAIAEADATKAEAAISQVDTPAPIAPQQVDKFEYMVVTVMSDPDSYSRKRKFILADGKVAPYGPEMGDDIIAGGWLAAAGNDGWELVSSQVLPTDTDAFVEGKYSSFGTQFQNGDSSSERWRSPGLVMYFKRRK